MVSKRKTRKIRKKKRFGGKIDDEIDKSVFILYIKNTATQILMNILTPYEKEHSKSTRFKNSHKTKIIEQWAKKVELTDDEFREKSDNLINSRNDLIHPQIEDLAKMSEQSLLLIKKYNLIDECEFENKIITNYITKHESKDKPLDKFEPKTPKTLKHYSSYK
jgi:hypothetical protein